MRRSILTRLVFLIAAVSLGGAAAIPSPAQAPDNTASEPPAPVPWSSLYITADPAGSARMLDSLMAVDPDLPVLEQGAATYLQAHEDSLLLWDLSFVRSVDPDVRARWWEGVDRDAAGFVLRGAGDHAASAEAFLAAAGVYREVGHLRREAVAWGSLGVARWYTGDMSGVREAYLEALDARERLGDPVLLGRTLNGLGSVSLQLGDPGSALGWYRRARDVRATLDTPADLATTVAYIGNVQYQLGDLPGARSTYREALEIAEGTEATRARQTALTGLANVYGSLGEYEEAIALYEAQLAEAEANDDVVQQGLLHANLGGTYEAIGDLAEALRHLDAAVALQNDADPVNYANTLNTRGVVLGRLGDDSAALRAYREAAEAAEAIENPFLVVQAITNQGNAYLDLGAGARALAEYEEAVTLAREVGDVLGERQALYGKGTALAESGDYPAARATYRQVQAIDREYELPDLEAEVLIGLGMVYAAEGKVDSALVPLARAEEIGKQLGRRDFIWTARLNTGDVYEQRGDLDRAREYYASALEVLEEERAGAVTEDQKASLLGKRAYIYEAQIHVLAQLDRPEEAFTLTERGRARALLDRLAEARIDLSAGDPALAAEAEQIDLALSTVGYLLRTGVEEGVAADSLRVLKSRRTALERERADLDQRLRLADPRFAALDPAEPLSPDEVADRLLEGNDVLLEYSLGDSASYLWVVTRDDLRLVPLPARGELEAAAARLRGALVNAEPGGDVALLEAAGYLDETLLRPARAEIERADRVLLVPDGPLHFVPFEVLAPAAAAPPADEREPYFADRVYSLDGKDVIYGPSATTLATLSVGDRRSGNDLLAVADPAFGTAELAPLPQTRIEVEAIAALYRGGEARVLAGAEATESALLDPANLADVRILHLATHGLVDDRRPERSSLALAAPTSPAEDGYLRVPEIYGLDLSVDLVVLSACETGLGRQVRGEGVLGLPRAFFYAGSPRVVVSLWSVADRSTAELMASFYGGLVGEGRSAAEALRRAKAELRRNPEFAHPFHWAAFVVMGAPGSR